MQNRLDLTTLIGTEVAEVTTATTSNVYPNGNNEITGTKLQATLLEFRNTIDTLETAINESKFNLLSDTSDEITEGTVHLFATPTNLDNWLMTKTTDELAEGVTNLYYTDARVDNRINILRPTQSAPTISGAADSITISIPSGGGTQIISMKDSQLRTWAAQVDAALKAANILA